MVATACPSAVAHSLHAACSRHTARRHAPAWPRRSQYSWPPTSWPQFTEACTEHARWQTVARWAAPIVQFRPFAFVLFVHDEVNQGLDSLIWQLVQRPRRHRIVPQPRDRAERGEHPAHRVRRKSGPLSSGQARAGSTAFAGQMAAHVSRSFSCSLTALPRAAWNPIASRMSWCTFAAPAVMFSSSQARLHLRAACCCTRKAWSSASIICIVQAGCVAMVRSRSFQNDRRRAHWTRLTGTAASLCLSGEHQQLVDHSHSASVIDVHLSQQQFVQSLSNSENVLANPCLSAPRRKLVAPGSFAGFPDQFLALGAATERTCLFRRYQKRIEELLLHCWRTSTPPALLRLPGHACAPGPNPGHAPASCSHLASPLARASGSSPASWVVSAAWKSQF